VIFAKKKRTSRNGSPIILQTTAQKFGVKSPLVFMVVDFFGRSRLNA
jgi:hypothetical protein